MTREAALKYFAGKRFHSRIALEREEAREAECTFHPALISKRQSNSVPKRSENTLRRSASMEWHEDTLLQSIDAHRKRRLQDLEAKRSAQEMKELEGCTFRPDLHATTRPQSAEAANKAEAPVVVRGLGRFLKLRERAKQQQHERRLREEQVCRPNLAYTPRTYTIPIPFKLSDGGKSASERRRRTRAELREREQNECTFRPDTIESQRRKVLRNLLRE